MDDLPIHKLVSRHWKLLPTKGDDVSIKDPKLKQGYLGDLKKKTIVELEEVIARNERVLTNKSLVNKLKDKGKNLQAHQKELKQALKEAEEREKCLKEVPNQNDIHGFEWTGSLTNNTESQVEVKTEVDIEDDEDLDPLKLMAHHSFCVEDRGSRSSRVTEEDPSSALIRELERMEINDAKEEEWTPQQVPTFGSKRDEMIQEKYKRNGPARVSFKPFRPVSNPQPVLGLPGRKTPVKVTPAICISQEASQKLEKEYFAREKERELKLTIAGLARPNKVSDISRLPSNPVGKYRDTNIINHILESDEEEDDDTYQHGIFDDEDEDSCN